MYVEHPFAQYVRTLGKGRNGSRALTQEEAFRAMQMILAGEVTPEQLGAFLMLMRVKEEEPQEIAGAVLAVRDSLKSLTANLPTVDLDWSSYAGKRRHLPWYLLATLALAESGIRVFMHGASGHTAGRIYTKDVMAQLGMPVATSLAEASAKIEAHRLCYLDIAHLSPVLHRIIELRPFLGLRSPVHTIGRMINPFNAPFMMQGIFHPGYRPTHQEAALLLGQPHMAVIKGEGGEIERNPDVACLVQSVHNGVLSDEEWPAMFERRHVKDESMNINNLVSVWKGSLSDDYGVASVIGTMAIALKMMGKASTREVAESLAREIWDARPKGRLSAAA